MRQSLPRTAAFLALAGWAFLALQLWLTGGLIIGQGGTVLGVVIKFLGYFTILTNIFVALVLSAFAVGRGFPGHWRLTRPLTVTCATVSIVIVGAVYFLVLRHQWQPQGAQWVADAGLHYVMPVVMALFWWLAVPAGALDWRRAGWLFAYPLAYLVYVFVRGALVADYPYPFIDVPKIGYPQALLNSVGVLVAFAAVAGALLAVNAHAARRH